MKKVLIFLFLFLGGFFLFFWVIRQVEWKKIEKTLFAFSVWEGIAIIGVTLLMWLIGIWHWKFILKFQGYNFSTAKLGEILFASFAITYLLPTTFFGGEAFRVYAARKKFSLPWEKNIAAIIIERFLRISIFLLVLILGFVVFLSLADFPSRNFGISVTALIGILVIVLAVFYSKSFKKKSILKWFFRFSGIKAKRNGYLIQDIEKEVFHFFNFRKTVMWKGLGISFLKHLLILARCWLLIFFLTGETDILIALAILFFIHLSYLFPFPARLGSSEAAQAFAFSALGLGIVTGVTFSFLLRGAELLVVLLGLIFLAKFGIKLLTGGKAYETRTIVSQGRQNK